MSQDQNTDNPKKRLQELQSEFERLQNTFSMSQAKHDAVNRLVPLLRDIQLWKDSIEQIMDMVMEKFQAEAGSILLTDPSRGDLFFQSARGEKAEEIMKFRVPMGQGIAGHCAMHGQVMAVSDVNRDPHYYKEISQALGFETRSILCVPINGGEKPSGVIEVINKLQSNVWIPEEIDMLESIAQIAGILLQMARNNTLINSRVEKLARIISDGAKLQSIKEIAVLHKAIEDMARQCLGPVSCTLYVLHHGTGNLINVLNKEQVPISEKHLAGRAATTGNPALSTDVASDSSLDHDMVTEGIRTSMAVPLKSAEKITGVLTFERIEGEPFSEEDVRYAFSMSHNSGAALAKFLK